MKTFAAMSAAALIGLGVLTSSAAEARGGGGAVAAGLIGGLAAGALLGAALSESHAAPAYGYARPDEDGPVVYRERDAAPGYGPRRVVRYESTEEYDEPRPPRRWRRDCDRPDGYGRPVAYDRPYGYRYGGW